MSEVIEHLAEPLLDECGDSHEDFEQVITLTALAWNMTLFPPQDRDRQLREAAKRVSPERVQEEAISALRDVCDLVAERKRKFYPDLRHFIMDVRFRPLPDDEIYFEVAYTVEPRAAP